MSVVVSALFKLVCPISVPLASDVSCHVLSVCVSAQNETILLMPVPYLIITFLSTVCACMRMPAHVCACECVCFVKL